MKYRIGDVFWSTFYKNGKYMSMSYTVDGLDDNCLYVEPAIGARIRFFKWLCYSTKEECQAECNRLNHGIDIDKKVKL